MKKGFTLIELLSVIIILAIIALIAVPIVLNIINNSKESSEKASLEVYGNSVKNAIVNYLEKHPDEKSVTFEQLEKEDLIKYTGRKIECETVQIGDRGNVFLSNCTIGNVKTNFTYGERLYPKPELVSGLTPVVYDGNNWKVISSSDPNWYDYESQKWANAVVLGDGITKKIGDVVKVDGTEAKMMLVWIPRYEYKYTNLSSQYVGGVDAAHPGEIDIHFISKDTIKPSDENEYKIHPAFTFGDKQIGGFWIGKFELSKVGSATVMQNFRILPNLVPIRGQKVSWYFQEIKKIETESNNFNLADLDTHMVKNSEWGAVAYLSQSKYGKYGNEEYTGINKEIYQNKATKTGNSNGTPSQSESRTGGQCSYNDMSNLENGKGQCGPGASTTGNIYGVYDMSGGSSEYVMAGYGYRNEIFTGKTSTNNSGFNGYYTQENGRNTTGISIPEEKYYDVYITASAATACNGVCFGHALSETSGWYGDSSAMARASYPWLIRGGYSADTSSGIFNFSSNSGNGSDSPATRVIFIKK